MKRLKGPLNNAQNQNKQNNLTLLAFTEKAPRFRIATLFTSEVSAEKMTRSTSMNSVRVTLSSWSPAGSFTRGSASRPYWLAHAILHWPWVSRCTPALPRYRPHVANVQEGCYLLGGLLGHVAIVEDIGERPLTRGGPPPPLRQWP